MSQKWEEQDFNPNDQRVFSALSNPKWDFRTVGGISRETGLVESDVKVILEKYPHFIRKSDVPDRKGRELFTLRSRPVKFREYLARAQMFLAK